MSAKRTVRSNVASLPRIWGYSRERQVIGETRLSWLVSDERYGRALDAGLIERILADPLRYPHLVIKVPKKNPNKGCNPLYPKWFFSEKEFAEYRFLREHKVDIVKQV